MKEKIKCNMCGFYNDLKDKYCKNCNNELDINILQENDSIPYLLNELKVKLINDENCSNELNKLEQLDINNIPFAKYFINKKKVIEEYDYIDESVEDYEFIIKDIINSNDYSDNQRINIINALNISNDKKEMYISIINGSFYENEEKIDELINKTINKDINIALEPPKMNRDRNFGFIMLYISIGLLVIQLLVGLLTEAAFRGPLLILFSLIPALSFTVAIYKIIDKRKSSMILINILMFIAFFLVISYIMSSIYYGFVGIKDYFSNVYHSIGNIVDEINKRYAGDVI